MHIPVYSPLTEAGQRWRAPPAAGTSTDKETTANMNNRDCSRTWGGAGRAVGVQLGMAVSAVLAVSACSSVPDAVNPVEWYKSAEQAVFSGGQTSVDAEAAASEAGAPAYTPPEIPGRNQPFPNLGDGPERPVARTPAETSRLTQGLIADRAQSRHSERAIPLQGMSGERRAALPMMADGALSLDPEAQAVATASSPPQVIRTQIGPAAAPRGEGAAQAQGPTATRGPSGPAGRTEQETGPARVSGAPAATVSAPRRAGGAPSRLAFSNVPPPAAASTPASAPPPRPTFSDVAPPTLGLSSAPSPRQQPTAVEPPVAAAPDLVPPPPPPGSALSGPVQPLNLRSGQTPGQESEPTLEADAPSAPQGRVEVPEATFEEEAQDTPLGNVTGGNGMDANGNVGNGPVAGDVAALGQAAGQAAEPARSERIATIHFARETAELGEAERDILRQVAALHQQRGGMIRVVGHGGTATGNESTQEDTMNAQISLERANTVAQELIRLGVSRQEIRAVALAGAPAAGQANGQAAEIYFIY
jgi:outer membrane protein OmpA-like peptidoglycan-associated protein